MMNANLIAGLVDAAIPFLGGLYATLLGNRNRFATLINLSSKYLFSGSHNAIVGETPYVVSKHKLSISPVEKQRAERRVLERKAASRQREPQA